MAVTDYAVSGGASWADQEDPLYVGLQGQLVADESRAGVAQKMSRAGTVSKLRVRVVSSSSNGSVIVTLMIGTSATDLSVTIASDTTDEIVEDTTNSAQFYTTNELCWRIDLPADENPDTTTIQWISCEIGA